MSDLTIALTKSEIESEIKFLEIELEQMRGDDRHYRNKDWDDKYSWLENRVEFLEELLTKRD